MLFSFILISGGKPLAQCSDAGICILGKKHEELPGSFNNSISLSYVLGSSGRVIPGDDDIIYNSFKLTGEFQVFKASRIGFSIPFSYNTGDLGSVSGIGDLSVFWTYTIPVKHNHSLSFQLGGKFATGKVNVSDSFPQAYMPGLGTNDLLISAEYSTRIFNVAAGYQKSFGRSANYVTRLKRGDDIMLRAGYQEIFNKLGVKAEVLTLLRLQESSIQDPLGLTENFITIGGSNESQVNLIGEASYSVSKNFTLTGLAAIPLLRRDFNLDGLRRSFTVSAGVTYFFPLE